MPFKGVRFPEITGQPIRLYQIIASGTASSSSLVRFMIPIITFRKFPFRHLLPCAVLALVITVLVCWNPFGKPQPVCFNVLMKSSVPGTAYFDVNVDGIGLLMRQAMLAPVEGNERVTHLKFNFASGRASCFVFDPLDRPGTVEIQRCWISYSDGEFLAEISPAGATTSGQEEEKTSPTGGLRLQCRPNIPFGPLKFIPRVPVEIPSAPPPSMGEMLSVFAASMFGFFLISVSLESRRERLFRFADIAAEWIAGHARSSIFLAAIFSVAICLFPVIFGGKSFVSPDNGIFLLYAGFPTVPGGDGQQLENPVGSDFGATMYWHLPTTAVEHRAIFKDGEFPLWNRTGWGGFTLLGESISMIGDPLTWPAIVSGGSAWAWDLKFILARILFATGVGWLVYRTSRSLSAALLLTLSAPFMGFFVYRFCHVANISLCYSPWILVAWCEGARARSLRRAALWSGLMIFANWCELNSGTAKESSALILFMNAGGGLMLLLARESWRWRAARLALFGWASIVFLLLSAPLWLTFLDALSKAWTIYNDPKVYQMQPGLLIGLFDDIFQRQIVDFEYLFNPSANFFVLLGVLWAAVRLRDLGRDSFFLAASLTGIGAGVLAFGVIPPAIALRIPMLRNIIHWDNTFSCPLFIVLFVIAGFGIRECFARMRSQEWKGDWTLAMVLAGVLLAAYFGLTQASHRVAYSFLKQGEMMPRSVFFVRYVPALLASLALLPWAFRELRLRGAAWVAWALTAACLLATLHFRHGTYFETKFDLYTANPKKRIDMRNLDSPALEVLRRSMTEPGRVLGIGFALSPGFNAMLGFESPSTPDALMNARMLILADALDLPRVDGWRMGVVHQGYAGYHRALDMFNVTHLVEMPGQPDLPGVKQLCASDLVVSKSETAWPRAFFTNQVTTYQNAADLARMVRDRDGRPFAALSAEDRSHSPLPAESSERLVVKAERYHLTNNTTSFEIDAPSSGLAVLMEANIPGDIWATVDGVDTPCATVDYAFRGVMIDKPGRHVVKFGYWPAVLEPALWCGVAGLISLLMTVWLFVPRRSRAPGIGMVPATANTRDPMVIHQ